MNRRITILNELEAVAPALVNMPVELPYSVPNGYFHEFSDILLHKINNDNSIIEDEIPLTKIISTQTPYLVPKAYFENLSDKIVGKVKGLEIEDIELQDIVQGFIKINPYQVPALYFSGLANRIFEKINLLENNGVEILTGNFSKQIPYQVPIGYFDNLAEEITQEVTRFETDEHELLLNFPKAMPYHVPIGYFNNLSKEVMVAIKQKITLDVPNGYFDSLPSILLQKVRDLEEMEKAKTLEPLFDTVEKHALEYVPTGHFSKLDVYSPPEKIAKTIGIRRKTNWFKNAIAACLVGSIGFTAYQLMNHTTKPDIAVVPYIQPKILLANVDVDKELSKLDDVTIASYLDNETLTESTASDFQEIQDDNLDQVLQQIPDSDLQKHLSETGEPIKQKSK